MFLFLYLITHRKNLEKQLDFPNTKQNYFIQSNTNKLMPQGFLQPCLMSAFHKFFGRYNDQIYKYKLSLSHMLSEIFHTNGQTVFDGGLLRIYDQETTASATGRQGMLTLPRDLIPP